MSDAHLSDIFVLELLNNIIQVSVDSLGVEGSVHIGRPAVRNNYRCGRSGVEDEEEDEIERRGEQHALKKCCRRGWPEEGKTLVGDESFVCDIFHHSGSSADRYRRKI